jgi:hypothetical protein
MGPRTQPAVQAQSAGCKEKKIIFFKGRSIEVYQNVKVKRLEWAEDLATLPNRFCPLCGRAFDFDDTVVEVEASPVLVYTGDYESDGLLLAIHLQCLVEAFFGGESDE